MSGRLRQSSGDSPEPGVDAKGLSDMLGARPHIDVKIPRTEITGKMRLLSRLEHSEARAAARRELGERGIPTSAAELMGPGVMDEWNCEIAAQTVARAMRDPADVRVELAPIDEWLEVCDDDQISALYLTYKDLADRLDPLGRDAGVSDAEMDAIDAAAKKKDVDLLMAFGCRKLALYATTSAAPPAS